MAMAPLRRRVWTGSGAAEYLTASARHPLTEATEDNSLRRSLDLQFW
jgi:hypothetical protein